jgi:tetratricopeptide (TPR) repeat protein
MRSSRALRGAVFGVLIARPLVAQQPAPVPPPAPSQAGASRHPAHPPAGGSRGTPRLGTIDFPTSGPVAAQAEFLKGVLYLHSFEYQSALGAFQAAESLAPGFAMAYWGEAMTMNHGVWNEQDAASARRALGRLGPTARARRDQAPTAREQGYLDAVEALYGEGSKPRRDTLYALAMERVVRENPADLEAKAFYALALLGLNQGVRDTATYLRAAPYADTVFKANPDHPGAAHYLIHAYDDPIHASQGLAAARAYARIAPDAPHAQHMTTHIFMAMGMWDDVVAQNEIAVGLTAEVPGHYTSWLLYGLLQQGRYAAAGELLERVRGNLAAGGSRGQYGPLVDMRAQFLLHSEDWRSPVLRWRPSRDSLSAEAALTFAYTNGAIAWRRHDTEALLAAAEETARLTERVRAGREPRDPAAMAGDVMTRELGAMVLFLSDRREEAVRRMREAAAIEDAKPMEFGPPAIVEPSHELLGTMLLEMRPEEARREFERALVLAPGRSRALIGLVRAAVAVGDKPAATRAMDRLQANWRRADPRVRDAVEPLSRLVLRMP